VSAGPNTASVTLDEYTSSVRIFDPLFAALNRERIRYVVVGGLATVLHGHARLTLDVDLVVDLEPAEARKAINALSELGLQPRAPVRAVDFADPKIREAWIRDKNMTVFSLWNPSEPMLVVDLFVESPIPFEQLWSRAEAVQIRGESVRIASIPDLIRMKEASGRPQDRADIEALREIARRRAEGEHER
jgi:hypothetical protein